MKVDTEINSTRQSHTSRPDFSAGNSNQFRWLACSDTDDDETEYSEQESIEDYRHALREK